MVTGISFAIIIVLAFAVVYTEAKGRTSTIGGVLIGAFITLLISIILFEEEPPIRPIDVYRGKTTLEITYRDSVALDSVVVWKEGVK
jgi:hypothetical protein